MKRWYFSTMYLFGALILSLAMAFMRGVVPVISASADGAAGASTVPLSQLKMQVPERLRMTFVTDAGETVAIDAPVILPEADVMPALLVRPLEAPETFLDVLNNQFNMTSSFKESLKYNKEFRAFNYECAPTGRTRICDGAGMARLYYRGCQPDNNEMPVERPAEKAAELMALCGVEQDIRVTWQAATSMAYHCETSDEVKQTDRGDLYVESAILTDRPGKGYEKGFYELMLTQYVDGIPILERAGGPNYMKIIEEDDFWFYLMLYETERILEPNYALAEWKTVEKAIGERIRAGVLHSVTKVQMGYALRDENDATCDTIGDRRYRLIPIWRVYGYDDSVQQLRAHANYTNPTEEEMWSHETAYSVDMDAQNGEWSGEALYAAHYGDFLQDG